MYIYVSKNKKSFLFLLSHHSATLIHSKKQQKTYKRVCAHIIALPSNSSKEQREPPCFFLLLFSKKLCWFVSEICGKSIPPPPLQLHTITTNHAAASLPLEYFQLFSRFFSFLPFPLFLSLFYFTFSRKASCRVMEKQQQASGRISFVRESKRARVLGFILKKHKEGK